MAYWLMKSEPDVFSIENLIQSPEQTTGWDGVRNFQARNMLRDQIKAGDRVFFYHSNCKPPGIVGIMEVTRAGYPDLSDPLDKPYWYMVDVRFEKKLKRMITLNDIKQNPGLSNMPLVRKGNRLSVMPVTSDEWQIILNMVSEEFL